MQHPREPFDTLSERWGPPTPKKPRRRGGRLLLGLLVAAMVGVGVVLALRLGEYQAARQEYEAYAQITEAPLDASTEAPLAAEAAPPQPVEPLGMIPGLESLTARTAAKPTATPRRFYSAKVSALRRDNQDTVGWLEIPGTSIAYPLVQTDNNEYYVEHTFSKKRNPSGAIFMDCWNTPDFSNFNTVIFGHNMNDGSMFAGLREYERQAFLQEHPTIEVTQFDAKRTYQVFAAYVSQGEGQADFRGQEAVSEHDRGAFLYEARKRSLIKAELVPTSGDRVLTLATCTSGRHPWYFVVHAVLTQEQLWAEE